MTSLPTKDFATLTSEQAVAIQGGSSNSLVDLSTGSILRAVIEAYSAVALWLQALIIQVLGITRAATSTGSDLDSWMADYGVTRLAATFATGIVTFSRFTPTNQAIVPVGAVVQTADGTQQYKVVTDLTNAAFSAAIGGYVVNAGTVSVNVSVQAVTAGVAGNALIGSVNTLAVAISGIDTVSNAAAFAGGADAESDTSLRARFVAYIASLSKATKTAVAYAINAVNPAYTFQIIENQNRDGSANIGYFYVVLNDGTGAPSSNVIAQVYQAVDAVRGLCIRFGVFAPTITQVSASLTIATATGSNHTAVADVVRAAIINYINAQPIGSSLVLSRIVQVAHDASASVIEVTNVLINGSIADIPAVIGVCLQANVVTVS
jgi:uncharacterized phage protein gp47/JayE